MFVYAYVHMCILVLRTVLLMRQIFPPAMIAMHTVFCVFCSWSDGSQPSHPLHHCKSTDDRQAPEVVLTCLMGIILKRLSASHTKMDSHFPVMWTSSSWGAPQRKGKGPIWGIHMKVIQGHLQRLLHQQLRDQGHLSLVKKLP